MLIVGLHAEIIVNQVKQIFGKKGYKFFDDGKPFDLNIVGVRSKNPKSNKFDDALLVLQLNSRGKWEVYSYQITTDPGSYWLENPGNVEGTAILVPGQYRSVYKIGLHVGKYPALVQFGGKVKVWRDASRDAILDWSGEVHEGYYGINIHRAKKAGETDEVNRWSAGCQVFKNADSFDEFLNLAKISSHYFGDTFTYTLLTQDDFE